MDILKVSHSDLDKILEIENESFIKPFKKENFLYELNENPFSRFYKLVIDNEIIGFLLLYVTFDSSSIVQIAIKKDKRNQGFAGFLLQNVEKLLIKEEVNFITLEVRVSNQKAINLYQKHGFKIVSTRKNYYENHEDAYLMIKELNYDENISN